MSFHAHFSVTAHGILKAMFIPTSHQLTNDIFLPSLSKQLFTYDESGLVLVQKEQEASLPLRRLSDWVNHITYHLNLDTSG